MDPGVVVGLPGAQLIHQVEPERAQLVGRVGTLLVGAAQHMLGPFGKDTDLRRFGESIAARGGKIAKRRALVAVARKLAVLLHRLWVTGEVYEPLRNSDRIKARKHPDLSSVAAVVG